MLSYAKLCTVTAKVVSLFEEGRVKLSNSGALFEVFSHLLHLLITRVQHMCEATCRVAAAAAIRPLDSARVVCRSAQ